MARALNSAKCHAGLDERLPVAKSPSPMNRVMWWIDRRERDKLGEVERRLPRVGLACGAGQRRRSVWTDIGFVDTAYAASS